MKRNYIYAGLICFLSLFSSCDDSLQKDTPSVPSESIFSEKKVDFDYILNSCYSVVYEWPDVFSQPIPSYDNLTDNSLCRFDEDTYERTKTMMMGDITNADRKYMEAQGKALRAYFYHWLYLCYKEVPVFTEFLSLENQYQPKAIRKEIHTQIIKYFSEAAAVFDDRTYMDTLGRMTKSTCLAFIAKVTMFNGFSDENGISCGIPNQKLMWQVMEYCEQIKGYSLDDDLHMAFVESKQMESTEMIFSARYGSPDICNNLNEIYCGSGSGLSLIQRTDVVKKGKQQVDCHHYYK